jgi:hypothetical protein
MNLNTAMAEARILMDSGQAVILVSGSGMGKSQMAMAELKRWIADGTAKGIKRGGSITFLATHTPPDMVGYKFRGDRDIIVDIDAEGKPVTRRVTVDDPSCPLWYISTEGAPAFCYDEFMVIFDEYGQAEPDVKRAAAEITLSGGTPPWYAPNPRCMMLTNEGSRYGVTKDFDFAIARRTMLRITGDIDASLMHMDKPYVHRGRTWSVMPVIKAWAAANPQLLFETEPAKQEPWCNPRQLYAYDRYLQDKFAATGRSEADPAAIDVGAGTIGMPATQSVVAHLQFQLQLPSYADVVADPDNTERPTRGDLQMLMAYQLAGYTQPDDLEQVIKYMSEEGPNKVKMPKDMSVTYITSLLRRDYKGIINHSAMQKWVNKNAALISVISSLSQ